MLPHFGLNNLFGQGVLSASSADPDNPIENIADGLTFDFWVPAPGSPLSVEEWAAVEFVAPQPADYFAVAAHTLKSVGASVTPQYWNEAVSPQAWVNAGASVTPIDNGPFRGEFTYRLATRWRLLFTGYTGAFRVGVAHLGLSVQLQRGMPLNWQPPLRSNEDTVSTNNMTVGGHLLGRNIVRQNIAIDIPQNNVTRSWVDSTWEPLIELLRLNPAFFWWSKDHAETVYGAMSGDPKVAYNHPDILDVSLKFEGRVR